MHMHITRPVVIASEAGLRHLASGLVVELTDAEADQVRRQNAGSATNDAEVEPEAAKASKKKAKVDAEA